MYLALYPEDPSSIPGSYVSRRYIKQTIEFPSPWYQSMNFALNDLFHLFSCRFNLRKLSELPYHLIRSHRYEDLFSECLFNYSFLRAKLASMPLQLTLADFEDLLEHAFDKDSKLLADTIRLETTT